MQPSLPAAWYALAVRPRYERITAQLLDSKGFEQMAPVYRHRRRWSDRVKELELLLFPGYVFCRFDYYGKLRVLSTPGVTSIVGCGKFPVPVDDSEIDAIRAILASRLRAQPWPYLRVGEKVRIEQGCLYGLTGTLVREKDSCRVVVNVELLRRSVAVEIQRDMICRA